ncbi:MAG TPA: acetylglutamate kinase [Chitinivibrionales bacterium]|nr:acetylglutamate kinase [Chitinivibrionales bacterium]
METVCIKIGGSTLDATGFCADFAKSIAAILRDFFPVIVHGGGKDIGRQLDLLKKEYKFVEGMRVTDAETVGTVQMVLSGDVNKRLVNSLETAGVHALGISGVDCNLLTASRMTIKGQDIGFVGNIDHVDTRIIDLCAKNGIVPVVSPISRDNSGNIYNVNADVAASEIAKALHAAHLVFVSDVAGVLVEGKVRHTIKTSEVEDLIAAGHIKGGMMPKVRGAKESVENGVRQVHICGWNGKDTFKKEMKPDTSSGTVIMK